LRCAVGAYLQRGRATGASGARRARGIAGVGDFQLAQPASPRMGTVSRTEYLPAAVRRSDRRSGDLLAAGVQIRRELAAVQHRERRVGVSASTRRAVSILTDAWLC